MTDKTLLRWYESHKETYHDLAANCSSVPELLFKIEVFGEKWTKWDWIMFFHYLTLEYASDKAECECGGGMASDKAEYDSSDEFSSIQLVKDIFDVLDRETTLDSIMSNKTIISNFIVWTTTMKSEWYSFRPIFKLLAHVFKKFPELWTANFMWIRHGSKMLNKKGRARTHKLEASLAQTSGRSDKYFNSRAFLDDFIFKYYSCDV